ncbi:E3 ubiquitin-protein ligase DZIP3-like [Stylophora pistillata]|uniref:E3 ubiquitin-protein ligase DZIP3-like n=1 Tax=Stylophora pistillata TaxID=50429 RepID=UPI000C04F34C|nr:E3 ubiquitin-protein ligase DZIP3-like [Stylophora pistillata]XP_022810406.1 E3 ubiquitin-protein ligase DZIP3-like [Stylophora pistillata]
MASATLSNCSTKETTNYARLCHLLVHVGSCVLREIFDRICPPENLHIILAHPWNRAKLQTLRKKRVLSTSQWHKLYSPIKSSVSSGNFDTFVLLLLLRNIFGLTLPTSGHDVFPPLTDTTPAADITLIKILRDRVYSQVTSGSVDDATFSSYWNQIKDTFLDIAGPPYQDAINEIKLEDMDANLEEDYGELLREWLKDEDCIADKLHEEETVKRARKEEDMEDLINISEQNSGMEGVCVIFLLIPTVKLTLQCEQSLSYGSSKAKATLET